MLTTTVYSALLILTTCLPPQYAAYARCLTDNLHMSSGEDPGRIPARTHISIDWPLAAPQTGKLSEPYIANDHRIFGQPSSFSKS
jgi:hypothetical protein